MSCGDIGAGNGNYWKLLAHGRLDVPEQYFIEHEAQFHNAGRFRPCVQNVISCRFVVRVTYPVHIVQEARNWNFHWFKFKQTFKLLAMLVCRLFGRIGQEIFISSLIGLLNRRVCPQSLQRLSHIKCERLIFQQAQSYRFLQNQLSFVLNIKIISCESQFFKYL